MKKIRDHDILMGIKNGDNNVIMEFYKDNLPKIERYVLRNLGNAYDAKDIFQDALVIIYKKINILDIECAFSTYFFAICKNLWLNKQRKQRKMVMHDDLHKLDITLPEDIINFIASQEKISIIQKYCLKLGEGCKKILLLFYSGYSIKEISKIKEFTEGYTRKRKFECQKKLIEQLEKDPVFIELKETSCNQ